MTKPLVVLLHGVGLDRSMWGPVVAPLPAEFAVRTLDLLGHGASKPAPAGTTLADLAREVAAALPGRAHLVGFSLGALVAQHLARYRPEQVASLTSVSSVCRRTPDERSAVLARLAAAESDFPASVESSLQQIVFGVVLLAAILLSSLQDRLRASTA